VLLWCNARESAPARRALSETIRFLIREKTHERAAREQADCRGARQRSAAIAA